MARFTLIAISNPAEGQEDACGVWYDDVHLADVLTVPGVVSAQRFELLRSAPRSAFKQFLAIYEVEAADEDEAKSMITRIGEAKLVLDETLDVSSVNLGVFRASGPALTAKPA